VSVSDVAIAIESLGKRFFIGHRAARTEGYVALRDVVAGYFSGILRSTRDMVRGQPILQGDTVQEFWALKDVDLKVQRGDRVGIIGRNGAGKSTLLKVLSRILEPTTGRVRIEGRIASLLEVGTGFHPELTGRENIYLNGSILGMGRAEIRRVFDAIVAFAEVEEFLDTPVKRYSSGMYVRLAFAVAAHLEPEILIVDEVLAVGDLQFQKKCLGKMEEVGKGGRTVLFVSHNMGVISQLCNRAVLLSSGRVAHQGLVADCVERYLSEGTLAGSDLAIRREPTDYQKLLIDRVAIHDPDGPSAGIVHNARPARLVVEFRVLRPGASYAIAAEVHRVGSGAVLASSTLDGRPNLELGSFSKPGRYRAVLELPVEWMLAGSYEIRIAATIPGVEVLDLFPREIGFALHDTVTPVAVLGEGRRGLVAPRLPWTVHYLDGDESRG
jgi:lipopolysaccharide transport system ATP-binding protein